MKTAIELISEERQRQITAEGWTPKHDDQHLYGSLAQAAATYATPHEDRLGVFTTDDVPLTWPWDDEWWKPTPHDRVRELVKAGALIAAEIDRLNRSKEAQ